MKTFIFCLALLVLVCAKPPGDGNQTKPDGNQTKPDGNQTKPDGNQTKPDAGGDKHAMSGDFQVKFLGASGGMMVSDTKKKTFLKMKQNKLEEYAGGKKLSGGFKMNVAGQNSWTDLKREADSSNTTTSYSTTFTAAGNGKFADAQFTLTAHFAISEVTVKDMTPCKKCGSAKPEPTQPPTSAPATSSPTAAAAQTTSPTAAPTAAPDNTGRRLLASNDTQPATGKALGRRTCEKEVNGTKTCAKDTDGACADGFTLCTKDVIVRKNELKFSFILTGVDMANGSTLRYGLELQTNDDGKTKASTITDKKPQGKDDKSGGKDKPAGNATKPAGNATKPADGGKGKPQKELKIADIGVVTMPTTATITSDAGEREVDVVVTYSDEAGKMVIDFEFPAVKAGETLYYDPAADMDTTTTTAAPTSTTSTSSAATLSGSVLFVFLGALFL